MATQKTDFSLSVNINPDTSRVQRTLDRQNFTIRTRLEVDTENIQNAVNRMIQQPQLAGFQKINTQIREGLTAYRDFGQATQQTFTNVTRYTETFKNSLGDVYERITTLTNGGRVLNSSLKQIQSGIANITTDTRSFNTEINGMNGTITEVSKTTTDTAGNIRQVITRTTEWADANNILTKTVETLDQDGNQLAPTITTIGESLRNVGQEAEESASNVRTLGSAFGESLGRLVAYYVIDAPIRAFRTALNEAITTVREFDSALIEFQKVSDLAGESLTNYVSKLAEMGELTGSTMQAMVEASTQFRKSGFNDEDSARLASVAEMFRNVADEEISAADSASFIIAQMKAFNIEADKSQHIIDAVNEVSNHFAVSSSDLSNNLGKVSAALAVNGVKYEEMLGMMTAITEVTRNASTASRGLNMISSRLVQTLDDSSSTGKKLIKIYDDLGIALKDENGQMRGTYDILKDLASQWNTLSGDQQKYIALTSAGARQTQNFVALMENFSQAVKATEMAYNSSGSAAKENARVLDSVEKKTEILRSEFQQIVIGKGGLQDFAKGLLDIGISALNLINNLGGLTPVLVTLTTLLVAFNTARIVNGFTNIANGIRGLVTGITTGIDAWRSYISVLRNVSSTALMSEGTVTSLSAAMQASVPIIGAVVAVIGLTVAAIQAHNQKLEEQKQKIRENIEAFADEYKALDSASEKLKNEEITREELNSIIDSNLDEYEAERLKLLDVNEAREKTIELIEAEKKAKAQELIDTGLTAYEESLDRIKNGYKEVRKFRKSLIDDQGRFSGYAEEAGLFNAKGAKEQNEALKEYKNLLIEARRELSNGNKDSEVWKNYTKEIERTEAVMVSMGETWEEDRKVIKDFDNALDATGQHYTDTTGEIVEGSKKSAIAIEEERKGREALNKTSKYGIAGLQKLKEQYHITGDAIQKYIEEHQEETITTEQATDALIEEAMEAEETKDTIESLGESYKKSLETTNTLVSSLDKVSSALKEQQENGSLSVKTQLELIEAGYATALMYDKETGACKLDEKAVIALVEAKLEMQIANLNIERSKVVEQLERERLQAISTAQGFLELAKAKNLANAAVLSYSGTTGGRNISDPSKSTSGYGGNFSYLNDAVQEGTKLLEKYDAEIEALESNLKNIKTNGAGAFAGVSKGASGAKKATDDLNKSLEETKKKYETVIKWISKQYDNEIDKIKKTEKEALKAEEAKIKAKEKEKDKALDAIESEIKALEKQKKALKDQKEALDDRKKALNDEKDAILDNIQPQIDALKDLSDTRKDYWDKQIDALKKANQELKDNLELQEKLDALEKAKNTKIKIYKEGQGFVYDVDRTAVAEAQKALDEYLNQKAYEDELTRLESLRDAELKNYEDRIKALEDYKDQVNKLYDEKIKVIEKDIDALERQMDELDKHKEAIEEHKDAVQEAYELEIEELNAHKEATQEAYEAEIEEWEHYKEEWEKLVNAYEEEQNRLLAQQLTGIDFENKNWMTRLDNLQKFINEYNKLQSQIGGDNTNVSADKNFSGGDKLPSGGDKNSSTSKYDDRGYKLNDVVTKTANIPFSNSKQQFIPYSGKTNVSSNGVIKKLASGTPSIKQDEIAIVGENPNQEIVIGSKINNGELMNLGKGTGVVNADSSKTLAGMLNQVGQFGASGFGSGNGTLNNNINNDSLVVNGVTIQGSNIKDPETFVNGLLNLKAEALQRAYKHR